MSEKFTMRTGDMATTAAAIRKLAEEFGAICGQLQNKASTMGDAYKSPDNLNYVAKMNECCGQLGKMVGKLNAAANLLDKQKGIVEEQVSANLTAAKNL